MRWIAFIAFLLAVPDRAGAVEILDVSIVSAVGDEPKATRTNKDARSDEEVRLYCLVAARVDGVKVWFSTAPKVHAVGKKSLLRWDEEEHGGVEIEWYKVEPAMWHVDGEGPDPEAPWFTYYANAHPPGSPDFPKWMGYDTIAYVENRLHGADGAWTVIADAHPTDAGFDTNGGLGTMRYKVVVRHGDQELSSPGEESRKTWGVSEKVHRVTFRQDDTFLGWITAWYNVPGIYGSSVVQVQQYVGIDCSDVLTAAHNASGKKDTKYTSAGGLVSKTDKVVGFTYYLEDATFRPTHDTSGDPVDIEWGDGGVREGDLVFFCYSPIISKDRCGRWHHVGAIHSDSGPEGEADGLFGADDLVLHAGPRELHLDPFHDVAGPDDVPTGIRIGRWK